MPLTVITDRTAADVLHWKELRDKGYANMTAAEKLLWDAGLKGAYKISDLNRVGTNLNTLRDRIANAGYIAPDAFTAKTNWTVTDVPTAAQLSYYLSCVALVRNSITAWQTTPAVPANDGTLDYIDANNIELILQDIEFVIDNLLAALYYCADLYSGEVL